MTEYNEEGFVDIHWLTEEFLKIGKEISEELDRPLQPEEWVLILIGIQQGLYDANPLDVDEMFYTPYYQILCNKYKKEASF